jgi:hypothetical protein
VTADLVLQEIAEMAVFDPQKLFNNRSRADGQSPRPGAVGPFLNTNRHISNAEVVVLGQQPAA